MPVIYSLASLCSASLTEHLTRDLNDMWVTSGSDKLEVVVRVERWSRLPVQEMGVKLPENMDWLPGPWLSSWDANLPATSPRYYYNDSMDKTKWLILGHDDDGKSLLDGEYQIENNYNYLARESCKRVLPCWPNTPAQIAQAAGLTGRQLQWFLSGRAQLNGQEQDKLMNVLSVELDMDGYYITSGPCVLIANNDRKIALVYEEISHGGDLDFSFEAVPEKANADPSWRYLLFQRCCGEPSIIMIPRGSKVSEHVDNDLFINFQGIKAVPDALYRDIVSTCARACEDPDENKAEMEAFGRRNLNLLQKYDRVNYLR
jgi:hypothetical protein